MSELRCTIHVYGCRSHQSGHAAQQDHRYTSNTVRVPSHNEETPADPQRAQVVTKTLARLTGESECEIEARLSKYDGVTAEVEKRAAA